jgi:hypothetical protein
MKDRFRFVYLVHSGWEFHKQAVLSISSLVEKRPFPGEILVYTDRPEAFKNLPVEPVLLTKKLIKSWQGPYGFNHRMKIELLRGLFGQGEGHLVYVDSDTFWTEGPERISEFLRGGCAVMHEREQDLSKAFFPEYLAILSDAGLLEKAGLPVTTKRPLWMVNAGVLGLPSTMDPELLEDVLRLCDLLSRAVPFKMTWVEQTAYTYIFQSRGMGIKTCGAEVYHYWRDSFEFNRLIRKCPEKELIELGKAPERVFELIEKGKKNRRGFRNQFLLRIKRLERSIDKRKREFLVFLDRLKFGVPRDSGPK